MEFSTEDIGKKRKFTFLREERYRFQGFANENYVETDLEVDLLSIRDAIPVFRIKLFNYKQSNAKGAYAWVGEVHELRNELVCTLNEKGQLGSILNIEEIREKWKKIKPGLQKRYNSKQYKDIFLCGISELLEDHNRLADSLRFAHPYLLLFPGIHSKQLKKDEISNGYRELPNFLATKKVPIITDEKLTELSEGKFQIDVTGKIDEDNFEQDKVTGMIRILKNRPRVPTRLDLGYIERYRLDEWPWSEQSMCMSIAEIPSTLYREEKNILKAI